MVAVMMMIMMELIESAVVTTQARRAWMVERW
jgi:hypothetical protein